MVPTLKVIIRLIIWEERGGYTVLDIPAYISAIFPQTIPIICTRNALSVALGLVSSVALSSDNSKYPQG